MKKVAIVAAVLVAGIAFGGPAIQKLTQIFSGGVFLVKTLSHAGTSTNKITASLSAQKDYDFPSTTDACEDSSAVSVPGAALGDPCAVGLMAPFGLADAGVGGWFECFVSAADNAKVRMCTHGAYDPEDAGFNVRVTSNQ